MENDLKSQRVDGASDGMLPTTSCSLPSSSGISSSLMKPFVPPSAKYPLKDRISISFSGGKTSAYMTKMLLDHFRKHEPWREIIVTFANTGQEHEETLKFVDRCDKAFGFGVVWLEAVVDPRPRVATSYKEVNFETAARKGEPFEAMIEKYGIPNKSYNHCTRELKLAPMRSYLTAQGWNFRNYSIAVGIRADEMDRVSLVRMVTDGVWYPCVDSDVDHEEVHRWWTMQDFTLNIPEHLGNCTWCWKKSLRKLMTLTISHPHIFDFSRRMERDHAFSGGARRDGGIREARVFFRENNSTETLFVKAAAGFTPFEDDKFIPFDDDLDVGGACGDSCEIYSDID
jgi:Phosphoadenosine phosphosulfate reductase family